jgi:predicted glycosyltransferase
MLKQALLHAGVMAEEEVDAYYRAWSEVGEVYDQGDYFDIFKSSDLMITDCASFLAEYLPSGHPLIRLVNGRSCDLDKLGKRFSDCYYNVHDEAELRQVFEELVLRKNDYLAPHRNEIAATLIDRAETAADKVLRDLEDSIK